ncbi:RHS repeat domain-containing protein [Duganella sp. HH105]|uniref:RHS repeat domain-containing protein n=1 Tax=Duganella sp. HH105 TaxID=1781067 RepID=UPI000893C9C8|nr:RHS repeat-associated core domain-containing protein [Duganella sp. HH105]OEZ54716.1 tRNA nuclease WapA precursor [Duganella sp. HH105]
MGFAHVTVRDEQSLLQTDTDVAVQWPLTGMVSKAVVSRDGKTLSQTINRLELTMLAQDNGQHTWFPLVRNSVAQRWDLSGADLGTTTTKGVGGDDAYVEYDKYGNVLTSRTVVNGAGQAFAHTTDTVNIYSANDVERSYLGLPDRMVVTKSHNGVDGKAVARTVAFTYETSGKVKTQTVEPDNEALALKTTFGYDPVFGVLLTKQLDWKDPDTGKPASRVEVKMIPEAKARFPYTIENAALHKETHLYDTTIGARTQLTGPNGLTTRWEVDGFGRVTHEMRADDNEIRAYLKRCAADCQGAEVAVSITEQYHGGSRIAVPQLAYMDNVGRVVRTLTWGFDGQAITSNKTYDAAGLPLGEDMPHYGSSGVAATHREYDALRRPVLVRTFSEPVGAAVASNVDTISEYDGLKVTMTNPKGQVRVEYKDVLGLTSFVENLVTKPAKKTVTTRFGYDAWGNLVSTIDPNGNVIKVSYDTLGRKTRLVDPDLGQIDYSVNPLGLTWKQVNPVQRAKAALASPPPSPYTKMKFDALNRMVERLEDDLNSYWEYDTAAYGIGQLARAYTGTKSAPDYLRLHSYDEKGRPKRTTQTLFDGEYATTLSYDAWGRVVTLSHSHDKDAPKVYGQRYNNYGYLARVERAGLVLWEATEQDAMQHVTKAKLGNGLVKRDDYNAYTGRLGDSATTAGEVARLTESYLYDKIGNVSQRTQHWAQASFIEQFEYDDLNRLTLSKIGNKPKVFTYDDAGNLLSKTDVGTGAYSYPTQGASAVRPHAVQSIAGVGGKFVYDGNGNLTSDPWHTATWNNFDMPVTITKGGKSSTFVYGAEHQRTRQTRGDGSMTVYGGAQEVELDAARNVVSVKTYWPLGLGVEIDRAGAAATELRWLHRDRLGSPVAISGEAGDVVEQLAYDAWGKRRKPDGSAVPDELDVVVDNKGFTGHEMLDQLDLVHMNGRVYDPLVGKFLSGDPLIQDPINGQNYNRYSYVLNNPTNATDPTGFLTQGDSLRSQDEIERKKMEEAASKCGPSCTIIINGKVSVAVDKGKVVGVLNISSSGTAQTNAKGQSASSKRDDIVRDAMISSPNRFVAEAAACVGKEKACAVGLASTLGGGWLASTKLGQVALALFGFGAEVQGMADGAPGRGAAANVLASKVVINSGAEVTPAMIQAALAGDKTLTMQAAVSLPAVQRYVDRLLAGEVAPAIKMDGQILVDGNHRYIAGKLLGQTPEITAGTASASKAVTAKPISGIKIDTTDWGNH